MVYKHQIFDEERYYSGKPEDAQYKAEVDAKIAGQIQDTYGDESINKALDKGENLPIIGEGIREFRKFLNMFKFGTAENKKALEEGAKAGQDRWNSWMAENYPENPDDEAKDTSTGLGDDPYRNRDADYGGDTGGGASSAPHDNVYAMYDTVGSHGSGLMQG